VTRQENPDEVPHNPFINSVRSISVRNVAKGSFRKNDSIWNQFSCFFVCENYLKVVSCKTSRKQYRKQMVWSVNICKACGVMSWIRYLFESQTSVLSTTVFLILCITLSKTSQIIQKEAGLPAIISANFFELFIVWPNVNAKSLWN